VDIFDWHGDFLGEAATAMYSYKRAVTTQILLAGHATVTGSTRDKWVDGH
jgi:hypothetical protein